MRTEIVYSMNVAAHKIIPCDQTELQAVNLSISTSNHPAESTRRRQNFHIFFPVPEMNSTGSGGDGYL